ncbi:MAG TPA: hypothetical protein DCM40_13295, partial [Maribacter sp.]|nr:hypothetical protein [Maribacter sp.]
KYLKIHQLVTAPTAQTNETKTLFQSSLKNSYSADDFRLRLSLWAEGYKDNMIKVDLTTVDHSIDRKDDALGSAVMTINYRGYIDQLFSHPISSPTISAETTKLYKEAQQKIAELINDTKCTGKLLQSVRTSYDRILENQIKTDVENNVLIDKLFTNSRIFKTVINKELVNVNIYGNSVDPRQNYIFQSYKYDAFERLSQDATLTEKGEILTDPILPITVGDTQFGGFQLVRHDAMHDQEVDFNDADLELLGKQESNVIFLGDFLTYIIDSLYEEGSNEMSDLFKQAPTRFIMTPIRVPNPAFHKIGAPEDVEEFITINPVQIPLSLPYIADWYENTFIKKQVNTLSVRDLLNNICNDIINNIVYETCFKIFDNNYAPPLLKTTNLVDHSTNWLKYNEYGWLDLDSIGAGNLAIMKANAETGDVDVSIAKNYVLFHQYLQASADSQPALQSKKENKRVPTLYYGSNFADTNYCSDVSFSKTDIEYLKEARVFNSGFGQLALLSNVYDLSFAFDSVKGSTFFLPGKKINFILTDWAGANKYHIGDDLGESDPHVKGRIANVLGFGGYYIITRVTYTLKSTSANDFVIKIDSKFTGTDAIEETTEAKESPEENAIKVDLPIECLQAARELAVRANVISDDDADQDIIISDPEATTNNEEATLVDNPGDGGADGDSSGNVSSSEEKVDENNLTPDGEDIGDATETTEEDYINAVNG